MLHLRSVLDSKSYDYHAKKTSVDSDSVMQGRGNQ